MEDHGPVSLKVLICDADQVAASILCEAIRKVEPAVNIDVVRRWIALREAFDPTKHNAIFIDPLTIGLGKSAEFVFGIRETLPNKVVFVLFIDKQIVEADRAKFYQGRRSRFAHYITFDKSIPPTMYGEEVGAVLARCRGWLQRHASEEALQSVEDRASQWLPTTSKAPEAAVVTEMREMIRTIRSLVDSREVPRSPSGAVRGDVIKDSVFVSYDFGEQSLAEGLINLLKLHKFTVQTGARGNTFISRTILDRIATCEYFVSLMTHHDQKTDGTYTTSPWLIEEKGAAVALGKPVVLLVEVGVGAAEIGGLQGDWQRIEFGERGFTTAALQAVEQLRSYSGKSDIAS